MIIRDTRPCKTCREEHPERWANCYKNGKPCNGWKEWLAETIKNKEDQGEDIHRL